MADTGQTHPGPNQWFEQGNFFNESDSFKAGKEQHVYRARLEKVGEDQYKVYVGEYKANTWKLVEGKSTEEAVSLEKVKELYQALKVNKIVHFQVVDFTEKAAPEAKANETEAPPAGEGPAPTAGDRAGSTPKETPAATQAPPSPTPEQKANATPGAKASPNSHVTTEARAAKEQQNKPPDSPEMIFAKTAIRTVAIGAAMIGGVALVAMASPFVAAGLGVGLLAKGITDAFLANANQALDEGRDVMSYDTVSGTVSSILPVDVKSAIAVAYGFDPLTGEEMTASNQAQAAGALVGGAVLAVAGTVAGTASQVLKATKPKEYLGSHLTSGEYTQRRTLIENTRKWANSLSEREKSVANKIINEHEAGSLYGIKKGDGTILTLEHRDKTATLDTLQQLFPYKSFGARNNGGRGYQSAHLAPSSVLKQLPGYKRDEALTAILPTKNRGSFVDMDNWAPDIHRRFDAGWKIFGIENKSAGKTHVSAQEYLDATVKAINNTPHLSQVAKQDLAGKITMEFVKWTKGDLSVMLKIPNNKSF